MIELIDKFHSNSCQASQVVIKSLKAQIAELTASREEWKQTTIDLRRKFMELKNEQKIRPRVGFNI